MYSDCAVCCQEESDGKDVEEQNPKDAIAIERRDVMLSQARGRALLPGEEDFRADPKWTIGIKAHGR